MIRLCMRPSQRRTGARNMMESFHSSRADYPSRTSIRALSMAVVNQVLPDLSQPLKSTIRYYLHGVTLSSDIFPGYLFIYRLVEMVPVVRLTLSILPIYPPNLSGLKLVKQLSSAKSQYVVCGESPRILEDLNPYSRYSADH